MQPLFSQPVAKFLDVLFAGHRRIRKGAGSRRFGRIVSCAPMRQIDSLCAGIVGFKIFVVQRPSG